MQSLGVAPLVDRSGQFCTQIITHHTAAKMVGENYDLFTELLEKDIAAVVVPVWMITYFLQLLAFIALNKTRWMHQVGACRLSFSHFL